jgi:ribosomal protein L13
MTEVKVKKNAAPASKKMGVVKCKITNNKTVSTSHKGVKKNWILIDAQDAVVGRLAAYLVHHLTGKHLASYTPHTDDGDKIVVINCDKVKFTGNKEEDKIYRRHSDYVGGMKEFSAKEIRGGKKTLRLVENYSPKNAWSLQDELQSFVKELIFICRFRALPERSKPCAG